MSKAQEQAARFFASQARTYQEQAARSFFDYSEEMSFLAIFTPGGKAGEDCRLAAIKFQNAAAIDSAIARAYVAAIEAAKEDS